MSELRSGYLIIYVMILTFVSMAIGLSVLSVASNQYTHVVDDVYRQDATYGAKACASIVAQKMTDDPSFTGMSDEVIFDDLNNADGQVMCTASVANGANGTKNVDIITSMRRSTLDSHPISYKMRAVLKATSELPAAGSTDYLNSNIFAGYGGFYTTTYSGGYLKGQKIYSLGKIYGAISHSLGSVSWPLDTVTVANMACGDAATWPQQCPDEPIQRYSGSNIPYVYAKTCAPGQSSSTRFRSPGLIGGCTIPTRTPLHFDKKTFVSELTNTIDATSLMGTGAGKCLRKSGANYYGNIINIPANTRINGNLTKYFDGATDITNSSNLMSPCVLIFDGPAYVTGSIGRNVDLDVDDNAAQNVTLVVNGKVGLKNSAYIPPSSGNKLLHIISFYSNNSTCSNSDVIPSASVTTCLSPQEARQASQVNTSGPPTDSALDVSLTGSVNVFGLTFYAYYGAVYAGCTDISIAAIGGQSVSFICPSPSAFSGSGTLAAGGAAAGGNPTFGGLTPGPIPEYKIVDIVRR